MLSAQAGEQEHGDPVLNFLPLRLKQEGPKQSERNEKLFGFHYSESFGFTWNLIPVGRSYPLTSGLNRKKAV